MKDDGSKYQFSKKGKISLIVVIIALAVALLSIILGMIGNKMGVIFIVIAIGCNLIAMIGVAVFLVEKIKYERIKNLEKYKRT